MRPGAVSCRCSTKCSPERLTPLSLELPVWGLELQAGSLELGVLLYLVRIPTPNPPLLSCGLRVLQEPAVKIRIAIARCPGVVFQIRIHRQLRVCRTRMMKRIDHPLRLLERDDAIGRAVKRPDPEA